MYFLKHVLTYDTDVLKYPESEYSGHSSNRYLCGISHTKVIILVPIY